MYDVCGWCNKTKFNTKSGRISDVHRPVIITTVTREVLLICETCAYRGIDTDCFELSYDYYNPNQNPTRQQKYLFYL